MSEKKTEAKKGVKGEEEQGEMFEDTKPPEIRHKETPIYMFGGTLEKVTTSDMKGCAETKLVVRAGGPDAGKELTQHVGRYFRFYVTERQEIGITDKDLSDLDIMTRAEMLFHIFQYGLDIQVPEDTSDQELRNSIREALARVEQEVDAPGEA